MKSFIHIEPKALRREDAAGYIGQSPKILDAAAAAGWIKPSVVAHRVTSYRVTALDLLLNRIELDVTVSFLRGRILSKL